MRAVKAEDRAVPLSNPPLQRPKPRKSSQNLEAQQGSGRRCIIDQQFTASPLNGRSLGRRVRWSPLHGEERAGQM